MIIVHVEVGRNIKNAMGKIISFLAFITVFLFSNKVFSQVITENNEKIERFLIMKNTSIDTNKIAGYRIQLAFNTDRTVIDDTKAHFLKLFPEEDQNYSLYQQPYWKFRVGNFYREIDALVSLKEIRAYFPDAFIVPDNIKRPSISN
jgi:hypothetical protein